MPYLGHMSAQTAGGIIPQFTIQDRLRKAREITGLDQAAFAAELGVSRTTISNYEAGGIERHRKIVLNAWSLRSGVPVEWLETGIAPDQNGPGEGEGLPRMDSNHQPSGYPFPQVAEVIALPVSDAA